MLKSNFNRLLLYSFIILKYPISKYDQEIGKILEYYEQDITLCANCFISEWDSCQSFLSAVEFDISFINFVHTIFGTRDIHYGQRKSDGKKVVIKHLASHEKINHLLKRIIKYDTDSKNLLNKTRLEQTFKNDSRIYGCQFCPINSIKDFINLIKADHTEEKVWMLLNINIQPLLLPVLYKERFRVPKLYGVCGLIMYTSYDGEILSNFYSTSFKMRLNLAIQLLQAAFKFTDGVEGYSFYLTDMTPDNIVFDEIANEISFIDFEDIIVVDSDYEKRKSSKTMKKSNFWNNIHKHEEIECKGCFAYIPKDICSFHKSDLNFYSVCKLISEDLYGNKEKGLLHSIPKEVLLLYPNLTSILETCISCKYNCQNRFKPAYQLLNLLNKIYYLLLLF